MNKSIERLALVRGTLPLTRVVLVAELSVVAASDRRVSVAEAAAVGMPSVSITSAAFLSSASDRRGLVAAAVVALGAHPIARSDL